jgi:hypothetical protein
VGEFEVALENLITNLADDEVRVSAGELDKIEFLSNRLGLDPKYLRLLKEAEEGADDTK